MPGPKTHQIFYRELRKHLNKNVLSSLPKYDDYSIYAQGHDFLIYHNFYKIYNQEKLKRNIDLSKKLQEYSFQEFVYQYYVEASKMKFLKNQQMRLFIGPGYIGHHILDAYTHPLIIYYAGDHIRDINRKTWMHGIVENLIDIYLLEQLENKDKKSALVYREFKYEKNDTDNKIGLILNNCLKTVYNFDNGGDDFIQSLSQISGYMHLLKYDPIGIKRIIFDILDPVLKGTKSFSYNRHCDVITKRVLNMDHDIWCNPMQSSIQLNNSFMELFNMALVESARIINQLEEECSTGVICKDAIYSIVPDIASTHGLECGKELEIKYAYEGKTRFY